MRSYPPNSPQAAARVVALTLVADGTICRGELHSLVRLDVYGRLKLHAIEMQEVLETLARDLFEFGAPAWDGSGSLHPLVMKCVLEDVSDPLLRQEVLEICQAVAQADDHLTDAERALLAFAGTHWSLASAGNACAGLAHGQGAR